MSASRTPRRLAAALCAGAVLCAVFLLTCVWCNSWSAAVLAPPARGRGAAASSRGTWLQQRLAAQGAPGVGGPLLWLWECFDPAGPRRECQARACLLRTGCAVPG